MSELLAPCATTSASPVERTNTDGLENVVPLVVKGGVVNSDQTHIIGTCVESELLQPCGIWPLCLWRNWLHGPESNPLHGRMIFEFHGGPYLFVCAMIATATVPPGSLQRIVRPITSASSPR